MELDLILSLLEELCDASSFLAEGKTMLSLR